MRERGTNHYMRFDAKYKPELCVADPRNEKRTWLHVVVLDAARSVLLASNGIVFCEIPCEADPRLQSGVITVADLKHARDGRRQGAIEVLSRPDPLCQGLIGAVRWLRESAGQALGPGAIWRVNPAQLALLSKAIAAPALRMEMSSLEDGPVFIRDALDAQNKATGWIAGLTHRATKTANRNGDLAASGKERAA